MVGGSGFMVITESHPTLSGVVDEVVVGVLQKFELDVDTVQEKDEWREDFIIEPARLLCTL